MSLLNPFSDGSNIFLDFIEKVNSKASRVLEIGSRMVSPGAGAGSKRMLFPKASNYVGFDYYKDSNTDVIGDCHELSRYFKGQKFDAIFSVALLEHLAMPWVVAMEIAKVLEIDGDTFHCAPQT